VKSPRLPKGSLLSALMAAALLSMRTKSCGGRWPHDDRAAADLPGTGGRALSPRPVHRHDEAGPCGPAFLLPGGGPGLERRREPRRVNPSRTPRTMCAPPASFGRSAKLPRPISTARL
jgi:hypothetical protein